MLAPICSARLTRHVTKTLSLRPALQHVPEDGAEACIAVGTDSRVSVLQTQSDEMTDQHVVRDGNSHVECGQGCGDELHRRLSLPILNPWKAEQVGGRSVADGLQGLTGGGYQIVPRGDLREHQAVGLPKRLASDPARIAHAVRGDQEQDMEPSRLDALPRASDLASAGEHP
ncbi:MAG: hypothetical protein ACYCW6_05345 [Candidatus Xenobia bacterium]